MTRYAVAVALALLVPAVNAWAVMDMWISWRPMCVSPQPVYTFWCDRESGHADVYIYVQPYNSIDVTSFEFTLRGAQSLATKTVPAWWQMGPGECREGAVWARTTFSGCGNDPWSGHAATPVISVSPAPDPNPGIALTVRDTLNAPVHLIAGRTYEVCRVSFGFQGALDPTACPGCEEAFLWGLWEVVFRGPAGDLRMQYVTSPYDNNLCLAWQGYPATAINCSDVIQMPPLPARGQTWGALKQLYR